MPSERSQVQSAIYSLTQAKKDLLSMAKSIKAAKLTDRKKRHAAEIMAHFAQRLMDAMNKFMKDTENQ